MAGADVTRFSEDRQGHAANYPLGVAAGAMAGLGDAMLLPILIPTAFVAGLTNSYLPLAAVPALAGGLWVVSQIAAAPVVAGRARKLPWATGAALVRAATIGLLAFVTYRADQLSDAQVLRAFFICFAAYTIAAGLATALGDELVRRSLAPGRGDGIYRLRGAVGGALAFVGGLTALQVLGGNGPAFPENFAALFVLAAVALGGSAILQALIREPVRLANGPSSSGRWSVAGLRDAVADPAFRRFLSVRVALSAAAIADPFYVVYGLREMAIEPAAIGGFLAALVAARMLTTPIWAAIVRRRGSRTALQLAGLVRLLVPLIAVLLPYLADTDAYRDRVADERITAALFGLTFVAYGVALAGHGVGNFAYLVNAIAPARRANAFAATNVALGLIALLPLLGAVVVELTSFETLFLVATVASLTGVFLSGALPDPDVRVRTAATAWRLRRARP
ncbi:MAG TPA: hypothetical protein VMP03_13140 [Methylomirabilota bacterium]|nr:hypothetical protein [Methylomirabilota bacterium]